MRLSKTMIMSFLFKKYKIVKILNKFFIVIRLYWFNWKYLTWEKLHGHYHGEYCSFDTYEEAEAFANIWCKQNPNRRWIKKEDFND